MVATLRSSKYATFHFDGLGQLTTQDSHSTHSLYLVYLYCARYKFEKAYALIKRYLFLGTLDELTFIYWLCKSLPALETGQKPIRTTQLLAIQIKALTLLTYTQQLPQPQKQYNHDFNLFLQNIPDTVIDIYTDYHRLSNNLSDDKKVPKQDHIATNVGMLAHLNELEKAEKPILVTHYKEACELLSLDLDDKLLLASLKYYFSLILDDNVKNTVYRRRLEDYCQRTVLAYVHLNECFRANRIKDLELHERRQNRLPIAIFLLRALKNQQTFRKAHADVVQKYSQLGAKKLEKASLWTIISDSEYGFFSKCPGNFHMPLLSRRGPIKAEKIVYFSSTVMLALTPLSRPKQVQHDKEQKN